MRAGPNLTLGPGRVTVTVARLQRARDPPRAAHRQPSEGRGSTSTAGPHRNRGEASRGSADRRRVVHSTHPRRRPTQRAPVRLTRRSLPRGPHGGSARSNRRYGHLAIGAFGMARDQVRRPYPSLRWERRDGERGHGSFVAPGRMRLLRGSAAHEEPPMKELLMTRMS